MRRISPRYVIVRLLGTVTSTVNVSYPGARNSIRCGPAASARPAAAPLDSSTVPTKLPSTYTCAVGGSITSRTLPVSADGCGGASEGNGSLGYAYPGASSYRSL